MKGMLGLLLLDGLLKPLLLWLCGVEDWWLVTLKAWGLTGGFALLVVVVAVLYARWWDGK